MISRLQRFTHSSFLKIVPNDGYTDRICEACLDSIQIAYNIRTVCKESERQLRHIEEQDTKQELAEELHIEASLEVVSAPTDIKINCSIGSTSLEVSVNKNKKRKFMCNFCGSMFVTKTHLRGHEQIHSNSKDFECDTCGKQFKTNSYLNRHIKYHLNERTYKCKQCLKGFNTSTTLNYHVQLVHSGVKTFQCQLCDKGFPLKIQLVSHQRFIY